MGWSQVAILDHEVIGGGWPEQGHKKSLASNDIWAAIPALHCQNVDFLYVKG